jgi:hypothetical protein
MGQKTLQLGDNLKDVSTIFSQIKCAEEEEEEEEEEA